MGRLCLFVNVIVIAWLGAGCVVPTPSPSPTILPPTETRQPPSPAPSPTATPIHTATPTASEAPGATVTPSDTPPLPTFTRLPPTRAPTLIATLRPLSVITFTIAPAAINPGEPVTLAWETTGERVIIYPLNALGQLTLPTHDGPPSGTLVITTPAQLRNQASYLLYALVGERSSEGAFASVKINCPDTWFFPNPPAACPGSPPHFTAMQAQHFERGLMLWTQWNDMIYLLYGDGASPRYDIQPNQWFAGMPESDSSIVSPAGLYQPVRGFGVAWRTGYVSPIAVVRDRLGWATDEEFPVPNAAYQCDSAPKYNHCYLSRPGGGVYVLEPERSGWSEWKGP